jgi:DNA-binding NarL/FixJ family response regulator
MIEQHTSILIIDDNRNFLKAISDFIQEYYPNQILVLGEAHSGREGVRLAQTLHPQVVLVDLKMPDLDGFKVIALLRQTLPEVKIITTSLLSVEACEQSGDLYHTESLKAGADVFISKNTLDRDLLSVLQAM